MKVWPYKFALDLDSRIRNVLKGIQGIERLKSLL